MMRASSTLGVVLVLGVLGCTRSSVTPTAPATAAKGSVTAAPRTSAGASTHGSSPAAWLIEAETSVWTLEGMLVAEADAALRTPAAKQALGAPSQLRFSDDAERRVRAYLRSSRSADVRARAKAFVATLNQVTVNTLAHVAAQANLSPEDVFMDYLTYDALFDLAIMRYGYKRWKAGAYTGADKTLADSFFSLTTTAPSAAAGIKVLRGDAAGLDINVFGGHVVATVDSVSVREVPGVGRIGSVEWTSTYEQLRANIRTGTTAAKRVEELEWDLGFRVNYAEELDEYLTWNATNPWAAVLYATNADAAADMYAGAAAGGGLQAGSIKLDPSAKLATSGTIGTKARGLTVAIKSATKKARLATSTPRRGQYVVLTVEVSSTLQEDLKAPAEWFRLVTADTEFPEFGVSRPGLAAAVLPSAPAGATLLAIPYTTLRKAATSTLVLVYDVPPQLTNAALVVGAGELALGVTL